MRLSEIETPALILDRGKLAANLKRMQQRMSDLSVGFRPHLKTAKSIDVTRMAVAADDPAARVTVSTLKEARFFAAHGYRDILYAVGMTPAKVHQAAALRREGIDLAVILDSLEAAQGVATAAARERVKLPVLIEIDSDGVRAGVKPAAPELVAIGRVLTESQGTELRGVMTHAGASYGCRSLDAITAMAEQERLAVVTAAERLRAAGIPCPVVSVGSTPTATYACHLDGVSEVRAGVYMFQDLVMAGLGVCRPEDIAISVLTEVIGHRQQTGGLIVDAGWMAMSRDRGTQAQPVDQGYGAVADLNGRILPDLIVASATQEHGVIEHRSGKPLDAAAHPIGRRLRILPNHACATAAQYDRYLVVDGNDQVIAEWPRFNGW